MKISIITSNYYNDVETLKKILDQETISEIMTLPSMKMHDQITDYAKDNNIKLTWGDPIAKVDKVIFMWDGTSNSMINSLKRSKVLKKKIKIIKYLML